MDNHVVKTILHLSLAVGISSHQDVLSSLSSQYLLALEWYINKNYPSDTSRITQFTEILSDVEKASRILLENKMIYIPFLLN